MRRVSGPVMPYLVAACGGSGSDSNSLPPDAEEMQTYLRSGVTVVVPRLGGAGSAIIFALNPSSPQAAGIQFDPDPTPGAPANSYHLQRGVRRRWRWHGRDELLRRGHLHWRSCHCCGGLWRDVTLTMDSDDGLGTLTGDLSFVLTAAGADVSGTGSFTEVVSGNTTTVTVDQAAPLEIKMATGGGQLRR